MKRVLIIVLLLVTVFLSSCTFPPSSQQSNVNNQEKKSVQYGLDLTITGKTNNLVAGENVSLNFHIINHMYSIPKSVVFVSSHVSPNVFSQVSSDDTVNYQIMQYILGLIQQMSQRLKSPDVLNIYFNYALKVSNDISVKNYQMMFYIFYLVDHFSSVVIHGPNPGDIGKTFFLSPKPTFEPLQITSIQESVGRKSVFFKFTIENKKKGDFFKPDSDSATPDFNQDDYNTLDFYITINHKNYYCDVSYFVNDKSAVVCQVPFSAIGSGQKQMNVHMNYVYILTKRVFFTFNVI